MTTNKQVAKNFSNKVVVVLGATGTGKSKLAIDLATIFGGEIINSDKIQVYQGLDVMMNKVTEEERRGVPHHLLGIVEDPNEDFEAEDFVRHALLATRDIAKRGRLPIIAGGSNSFVQALIDDPEFGSNYECCFFWVDVSMPVLHLSVHNRVDQMVAAGLVEEARGLFEAEGDYNRGIRRSIGMPEMDGFLRVEESAGAKARAELLEASIDEIKANTCKLIHRQLEKIFAIAERLEWRWVNRLDATEVHLIRGEGRDAAKEEVWQWSVVGPSTRVLNEFLVGGGINHHADGDVIMDSKSCLRVSPTHFAFNSKLNEFKLRLEL